MNPTITPFNLPMWLVQKTDGARRMIVHYHKFNQRVIPVAAAIPDLVSLFEQLTHPYNWYAAIDLANVFFHTCYKAHQQQLLTAGKTNNTPLLSYPRVYELSRPTSQVSQAGTSSLFPFTRLHSGPLH